MKLYYLQGACSLAVHIVLEWTGNPYETQSLSREELKQADYLALNPLGAVPFLIDGELQLSQNSAILHYLAEKYPEANLLGHNINERAQIRRWLGMVNSDVHSQYGLIFGIARYAQNEACQNELKQSAMQRLTQLFQVLNKVLENQDYLSSTRSIADAYLFVMLTWAPRIGLDLSEFKNLSHFFDVMQKDSGVQAALKAENNV